MEVEFTALCGGEILPVNQTPAEVDGRSVDRYLPGGADAAVLRPLLAEAEMLMHSLLNAGRTEAPAGPLPNGLWVSGGGPLPARGNCNLDGVLADDLLVCGLARNAGIAAAPVGQPVPRQGRVLCFLDVLADAVRGGDPVAHARGLGQVNDVVGQALAQGRHGGLGSVCVSDGETRSWCAGAGRLKHWWRRRRHYRAFLD